MFWRPEPTLTDATYPSTPFVPQSKSACRLQSLKSNCGLPIAELVRVVVSSHLTN